MNLGEKKEIMFFLFSVQSQYSYKISCKFPPLNANLDWDFTYFILENEMSSHR